MEKKYGRGVRHKNKTLQVEGSGEKKYGRGGRRNFPFRPLPQELKWNSPDREFSFGVVPAPALFGKGRSV